MRRHTAIGTTLALAIAVAVPAAAQDPAMLEAMARAGAVTEHHNALQKFAGTWDIQVKLWMDPSAPPMEMAGSMQAAQTLGGRYLEGRVESSFAGEPFTGRMLMGYNNTLGQYESLWFDNMNTALIFNTGSANAAYDEFTFTGRYKDPATGEWVETRNVMKFLSPTVIHEDAFEIRNGQERKSMEIHYTKR